MSFLLLSRDCDLVQHHVLGCTIFICQTTTLFHIMTPNEMYHSHGFSHQMVSSVVDITIGIATNSIGNTY